MSQNQHIHLVSVRSSAYVKPIDGTTKKPKVAHLPVLPEGNQRGICIAARLGDGLQTIQHKQRTTTGRVPPAHSVFRVVVDSLLAELEREKQEVKRLERLLSRYEPLPPAGAMRAA